MNTITKNERAPNEFNKCSFTNTKLNEIFDNFFSVSNT